MTEAKNEIKYVNKKILTTFQDFGIATTWNFPTSIGFEPTEVRLLQFGILNDTASAIGGLIVCPQIRDFQVVMSISQLTGQTHNGQMICPTSGPLSSLDFKFCVTGSDAAQATRDTQFWMVLEFLKR